MWVRRSSRRPPPHAGARGPPGHIRPHRRAGFQRRSPAAAAFRLAVGRRGVRKTGHPSSRSGDVKLLTLILNYRSTDLAIDCLRSLEAEVTGTPGFQVALIDNATGGDAVERLDAAIRENGWGGWVHLTASDRNLGFTGGNNRLIRDAVASADPPEYFLLLNADTVVEPRALGALVEFMDAHPRAGIAGSTLLSPEGAVQASPFRFGGVVSELDRGMRLGLVSRLLEPWAVVMPTPTGRMRGGLGLRREHDRTSHDARRDGPPRRGALHLLRRRGPLPARAAGRMGDVVRPGEPRLPPRGRLERDLGARGEAAARLLVRGAPAVPAEELRSRVRSAGGRGVPRWLRELARAPDACSGSRTRILRTCSRMRSATACSARGSR